LFNNQRSNVSKLNIVFSFFLLTICSSPHAAPGSGSEVQNYSSAYEQICREVKNRFYDKQMSGLNWDVECQRFRKDAQAANSRFEFQRTVNRLLGELHASHLGYFTSDDVEFYMLPAVFRGEIDSAKIAHIGVTGDRTDSGFVVHAVLDGSPAAAAGILPGDILVDAGGEPFSPVGSFSGRAGNRLLIAAERPGSGKLTFIVKPVLESPQRAFLNATKQSARTLERGGKRLGYLHLWCMTHEAFRQALEEALTGDLARTDGLVLDLRDGFGGNPFGYLEIMMRPGIEWEENRRGERSVKHTGYSKPIVVLINGGTRSAKEFLTYQLKKAGRAVLVGTRTAGAFLGASGVQIGSDGFLELPVTGLKVDGASLEGRGVEPDIAIQAQGTYGPNDSQLTRGLAVLLDRIQPGARPSRR
jgi:carboxyl-terminal processing protease